MNERPDPGSVVSRAMRLLIAPFGSGACVYDTSTNVVHLLGSDAAELLARIPRSIGSLMDAAHDSEALDDLLSGIAALEELGVISIDEAETAPVGEPLDEGSPHDVAPQLLPQEQGVRLMTGRSHHVLDRTLAFRSDDQGLLDEIDSFLQAPDTPMPTDSSVDVLFDVTSRDDGGVDLFALDLWEFPTRGGFFVQLPGVIHDFAAQSSTSIVFHAGAVTTPDGHVVLVPGGTGSGKSTLIAALVQQGCSFMGDEMIGVRSDTLHALCHPTPLKLDPRSRWALGLSADHTSPLMNPAELSAAAGALSGQAGPVGEVVLPVYSTDQPDEPVIERLAPVEALKALLANVTNLSRISDAEFAALCQLAERVPVVRVLHNDSPTVAGWIVTRRLA